MYNYSTKPTLVLSRARRLLQLYVVRVLQKNMYDVDQYMSDYFNLYNTVLLYRYCTFKGMSFYTSDAQVRTYEFLYERRPQA